MTNQSFPVSPLSDLLDSYAIAAMAELVSAYAPKKLNREKMSILIDDIARTSYYMAAAMLDARSTFHEIILEEGVIKAVQEEESDEA